jgi:hypothetical protein
MDAHGMTSWRVRLALDHPTPVEYMDTWPWIVAGHSGRPVRRGITRFSALDGSA